MSLRAVIFLKSWIDENIGNRPFVDRAGPQAAIRLAERLVEDAEVYGIAAGEIAEEVRDLPVFLSGALRERGRSR